MALSTRITARQSQQLTMTPQLRQAIELLQMSAVDLQKFIAEEVEKNPLLETDTKQEVETKPSEPGVLDVDQRFETALARPKPAVRTEYDGNATENLAGPTNLRDHLLEQLGLMMADKQISQLAFLLVHELDDDGYLRADLNDISNRLGATLVDLEAALQLVQKCSPTGVGARNLAECFALQLAENSELDDVMVRFLSTMDEIAVRPTSARWQNLGIEPEIYASLLSKIKSLNPAPGKLYDHDFTQYAIPDVTVFRNNLGSWSVELNNSNLAAITINTSLASEVEATGKSGAKYVSECTKRADWLMRSIAQRNSTIIKVATEIVRIQEKFFSLGVSHLRPLTMKDIAEKVKINESTVSRVANSKYLSCERGTFELKFFFSKAIKSTSGAADLSSLSIQNHIRLLIDEELPTKILSDDKIVKILNKNGVHIARRTVTKYREGMNIPSSVERRRFKANLDKIR